MLIGEDFEKITIDLFGATLLEPNAFIGDIIIFFLAVYLFFQTKKLQRTESFFYYWKLFYLVFGLCFFVGGFAHLFYNYWGINGKYVPWYLGIASSYMLESAMLSVFDNKKLKFTFRLISLIKFVGALVFATYFYITTDLSENMLPGLIIPTLNSVVGLFFGLLYLGVRYQKSIHPCFKYFWLSGLTLVPSATFQIMKINIHQLFDRNDVSHVLLLISLILYYLGIRGYANHLTAKTVNE